MTTVLFLCSLGLAQAADADPQTMALMTSPIGPVMSVVATLAMQSPAIDGNLRFHRVVRPGLGWTVQLDGTSAQPFQLLHVNHVSAHGGPRICLRKRGLEDWTVTPFALAGVTSVSAQGEPLGRYGVLGAGLEVDRTWVWSHFIMEIGLGAYLVTPFGFSSRAEVMADERAVSFSPVKPLINWSLGYAF